MIEPTGLSGGVSDEDENAPMQPVIIDRLAHHVAQCWDIAKRHKFSLSTRLTNCLRRRKGEYDPQKLEEIKKTGGSQIYMNLTGAKSRAAKALLTDLFSTSGDRPFSLAPTPIQELPPEIQEEMITTALQAVMQYGVPPEVAEQLLMQHEARIKDEMQREGERRMEKMAEYVEDVLIEGGYRQEFEEFLEDLVTYPFAILKGVVYKKKHKVKWVPDPQTGKHVPKVEEKILRTFKRVSPFNFYPSPSTVRIGDNWDIEKISMTPHELEKMRGMMGYNAKNIALVLNQYRMNGLREWVFEDGERERLEGRNDQLHTNYDLIDGLIWTGWIQGKMLQDWGVQQMIEDPYKEYSVSLTVIGSYTIRAVINPDPTGNPPYTKTCFRNVPNSFAGEALPEILADIQDAANATARALINNMAIGSSPQVAVDISMVPKGQDITNVYPMKVWPYSSKANPQGGGRPGVVFFSPEIKANELLAVYERFERYADEKSGIPAYSYGSDNAAGAGKTASGLSMLMNAASKTMKDVVRSIDINVIEPLIEAVYHSLMLDPTVPEDIKGDASVHARGSDALMHKEAMTIRMQELLAITNNPVDLQILGLEGRREQLREVFKNTSIPVDRVVPTLEQMQARQQEQAMAQQAQGQNEPVQ
ncbi:hypothetical protein [Bowmanella sp. JS7-9]|uniref:Portal protein n=1 Tax=Pseudobowmanella zhangzhouensis TaxID=1537679 RepID=A0ABW1XLQ7_9ALTE|nr:hypothetical protein [Bowmanella sp. JS7-9]